MLFGMSTSFDSIFPADKPWYCITGRHITICGGCCRRLACMAVASWSAGVAAYVAPTPLIAVNFILLSRIVTCRGPCSAHPSVAYVDYII
jgi:hypothetical protein